MNNAPLYARLKPNYRSGIVKEEPKKEKPKAEPKPKTASAKGKYDDMSFGAAFNVAKKDGLTTFPWRGKQFTTQTKEEKRAADNKRVRDANRAVLTNEDGSFKRGSSIQPSFGPQARAKTPAAPKAKAAPKAEAAPKRMKIRQDKPSGTFTPAKVSVPKVTQKVKKSFSPKPR